MMALRYWPGALIREKDGKLWETHTNDSCASLDEALKQIEFWRENYPQVVMGYVDREDGYHVASIWRKCYLYEPEPMIKPVVRFNSGDSSGNIFDILGQVKRALKKNHRIHEFNDIWDKVQHSGSYENALAVIWEKIDLIDEGGAY